MMKKLSKMALVISSLLACCATFALGAMPVQASAQEISDFDCSYSVSKDKPYLQYGSSEVITYTAQEAQEAGIPEGYSDTVLSVKPISSAASGSGILLDFSALEIPVAFVEEISFRFYLGESDKNTNGKPQLRIMSPVTEEWVYQPGNTASVTGAWATETVENTDSLFDALANEEGNLDKFELSVRVAEHVDFYIDSVTLKTMENDGVGPEIRCEDGDSIVVSLGGTFDLNVSAYDAQEKCEKPLEYIWETGVELDENGVPKEAGEYLLTLRSVDYFGNESEKTITVTVLEPDLEKPVISPNFTVMYAQVGMIPRLNFQVTDNQKVVEIVSTWSEGALDKKGALTEGTHTYTITAKDDSNNVSVLAITVYVTQDEHVFDNVIDEEVLSPRLTVTFDGENATVYKYGERVEEPADPVREDTEAYTYVFEGWYNGDVAWDFENDIVVEDTNLVSKWAEIPLSQDGGSGDSSMGDDGSDQSSDVTGDSSGSSADKGSSDKNDGSSSDSAGNDKSEGRGGCFSAVDVSVLLLVLLCGCMIYRRKANEGK